MDTFFDLFDPAQEITAEFEIVQNLSGLFVQAGESFVSSWPKEYRNRETGKVYSPHHQGETDFVFQDGPWRYGLAKGGEGGGKSVAGIVKTLERLKRGMSGIMVSPDLPHFKRSLWPEFRRWCPWDQVIAKHQYRGLFDWEPQQPFQLAFKTGAILYCGGMDDPSGWEGPNVSFAHVDEARRKKTADVLKVLDGRVRITGPGGEIPQLYFTTTPRKHWLFDYFGPAKFKCKDCGKQFEIDPGNRLLQVSCPECDGQAETEDKRFSFKAKAFVITLLTKDNQANLSAGFVEDRASSLTEAEARILLQAEWEDEEDTERFLPNISLWDNCKGVLPPLTENDPLVIVLDAGVSSDNFALVAVSPNPARWEDIAVRIAIKWEPPAGGKIDFKGTEQKPGPELILRQLCKTRNVVQVCFDPYQLHDFCTRLGNEHIAWFDEFSQQSARLEADNDLLGLIMQRRITHEGNNDLRDHINNADRKVDSESRKLRIVKREKDLKVDLAVALSMACHRLTELRSKNGVFTW